MNFLEEILDVKKQEVKNLKKKYKLNSFSSMEFFDSASLKLNSKNNKDKISLIGEVKKASPSKGIINNYFDHLKLAEEYFTASIDALSVLTDENFFMGSIRFLNDIAKIKTAPLLRKDFIIDEYQIYQSKAFGADIVLLISEILSKSQLTELTCAAKELGMDVLLEFHSAEQISKIDFSLNSLIGINNRNLESFQTDLETTIRLAAELPDNIFLVCESGISGPKDIKYILSASNVNAFLIGEFFMKDKSISNAIKILREAIQNES